ncbi:hypothetical protein GTO89_09915 [Heliobacterium gestii]|uniref:Uncharacterized protein n=1 Tax=Heliomicrobium gestii TaxID=2699 RepID=A0A845LFZ4_HELGE|nr:hypothetical protein [Heliomicrobium gestii]MBM7868157.1 hypothetical protein [Heliomicrobium gestii]MZP43355.1 hypothetical protein [Heliomicrobium gestii]
MDQGQRLFQGAPRELFARRDLLTQAGLELPWPMEMHQALIDRGILPVSNDSSGIGVPLDRDSLLRSLEQAWQTRDCPK